MKTSAYLQLKCDQKSHVLPTSCSTVDFCHSIHPIVAMVSVIHSLLQVEISFLLTGKQNEK